MQPCDAGIVQAVKRNYRKRLLHHVFFMCDQDGTATGPVLVKSVNLFHNVDKELCGPISAVNNPEMLCQMWIREQL